MHFYLRVILFAGLICFSIGECLSRPITKVEDLVLEHQEMYNQAKLLLNHSAFDDSNLSKAKTLIDQLIKLEPDFMPIRIEEVRWHIKNAIEEKEDEMSVSLNMLDKIKKLAPQYHKPYVLAASQYIIGQRDYQKGKEQLDIAETLGSEEDPWFHIHNASYYEYKRNYKKALVHAYKALNYSGNYYKAVARSVKVIVKLSSMLGLYYDSNILVDRVFESTERESDRMFLAGQIIDLYSGRSDVWRVGYMMIQRELKANENSIYANYQLAKLMLDSDGSASVEHCKSIDEKIAEKAEAILNRLINRKELKNKKRDTAMRYFIYDNLLSIAVGKKDNTKINHILGLAESEMVSKEILYILQARGNYCMGNYEKTIELINNAAITFPEMSDSQLLASAYSQLGDLSKLDQYYQKRIEKETDNAWLYGNYAAALFYRMNQIDKAIEFANKALALKEYGHARNTLNMALFLSMETHFRNGKIDKGRYYYRQITARSRKIFEAKNCGNTCDYFKSSLDYYDQEKKML